jgi:hypothetical protein
MGDPPDYRDSHLTIHVWIDGGDDELRARIRFPRPTSAPSVARGEVAILLLVRDALRQVHHELRC